MTGLHGPELVATLGAGLIVGALIGSVGIGGLLLTPYLVQVAGLDVRDAIAVSMTSFIATGLVALILFARGELAMRHRWPLILATMPGALLGAVTLAAMPERLAGLLLAAFLLATGLRLSIGRTNGLTATRPPSWISDAPVGAMTGFLSALTGTGGPMVLVPTLVWRGTPLLAAIALGQIVQLPVAAMATLGNHASGGVDLALGTLLGLILVPGVVIGRWFAEAMPLGFLTRMVSVVLVAAGLWMALDMI